MVFSGYESGKCVLVTGAAGFIGFHLIQRLTAGDWFVIGTDNIDDSYDTRLKYARLAELGIPKEEVRYNKLITSRYIEKTSFIQLDLEDSDRVTALFELYDIRMVCHLGGQVGGVRSNVLGFTTILENSRKQDVERIVYASATGKAMESVAISVPAGVDLDPPFSVYTATMRANELMAKAFSDTHQLPIVGVRLPLVYGPWGRPDALPMIFADALVKERPIKVLNQGEDSLDVLYIDDVVNSLETLLKQGFEPTSGYHSLLKLDCVDSVKTKNFIGLLEQLVEMQAVIDFVPDQTGERQEGCCMDSEIVPLTCTPPITSLKEGLQAFVRWYKLWYTGQSPLIEVERIVVGKYPFPIYMNWKYIWNKHIEPGFILPTEPEALLQSLIASDGFDDGLSLIKPVAWIVYVHQIIKEVGLKPHFSVFEVGCGGGAFLYPLYKAGYLVSGIDYASPLIHLAKLVMPDCRFEVCDALNMDTIERSAVVMANSVFQYFDSLEMAEMVLLKMFEKADRMVLLLNIPNRLTEKNETLACRNSLPLDAYDSKYKGLKHLSFEPVWFHEIASTYGWKLHSFNQQIPEYGKNAFRYNVAFVK